jgi:hypothetical protein
MERSAVERIGIYERNLFGENECWRFCRHKENFVDEIKCGWIDNTSCKKEEQSISEMKGRMQ